MKPNRLSQVPHVLGALLLASTLGTTVLATEVIPTLDPDFKPVITRAGGFVTAFAVQADGRILVAGGFNAINGVLRNGVARLNPDGSVDPAFDAGFACCDAGTRGPGATASISAMVAQKDLKVVIGGSFTNVNGLPRAGLARLNSDGSVDTTFNPGLGLDPGTLSQSYSPVSVLVVQSDGKLLVGGYFTTVNGVARNGVARLNADGSVDATFDPGSALAFGDPTDSGHLTSMGVVPNTGQVVISGSFLSFAGVSRNGIARLNANGSLDTTFDPFLNNNQPDTLPSIDELLVQADGKIVISGGFTGVDAETRYGLARLNADGTADKSFDPMIDPFNFQSYALITLTPDGKIIAYRQYTDASGNSRQVLARLNSDGTLDPAWSVELQAGEAGRLQVVGVAFQLDSKVLVAGNFFAGPNATHEGIARVDGAGALDAAFDPRLELAEGTDAIVRAVATQHDGKVLVGGSFNRINGVVRNRLARFNQDSSLDDSFVPVLGEDASGSFVSTILLQDDGKILIGGLFTSVNGVSRNGLARLNEDGTLDASFDVGTGTASQDASGVSVGTVSAFAQQSDGKVLVAGDFSVLNGVLDPWLGRLNANGSVDFTFSTGFGSCVNCSTPDIRQVAVLTNGNVMVSGLFDRVEAFFLNGLVRLFPVGNVDISFVPPILAEEQVNAMIVGKDDATTVAVMFSDPAGNANRTRLIRFTPDGAVDSSFKPDQVVGEDASSIPVSALALDSKGRLLIAGQLTGVGSEPRHGLARLNSDGTLDADFGIGAGFGKGVLAVQNRVGSLITAISVADDDSFVVGGSFATVNNQTRLGLARFQADQPTQTGTRATLRSAARSTDGTFSMLVLGEAGRSYRIDASIDLRNWTPVGNVTGAATPQLFTDSGAKTFPARFYRAVAP